MRLITLALCVTLLGAAAEPLRAQTTDGTAWSVGAGISVLTGTPHRPRPPRGEWLTGASGPEQGLHLRLAVERPVAPWLLAGLEASHNRLTTSEKTYNCLPDDAWCYPAAGVDELMALQATIRARRAGKLSPSATLGIGAGAFRLTVDEPFDDSELLEDRTGVRPVARLGAGIGRAVGDYALSLDASFQATIGRGGGTHHIPVVLSVGF